MREEQLTRSGVAYNLFNSPHKVKISYSNEDIIYTFSSKLHLNKFIDKLENNRKYYNCSLSHRFGIEVENNKLCDIKLYAKIENRGFLIDNKKEVFEWLNTIKLDGNNLIKKN